MYRLLLALSILFSSCAFEEENIKVMVDSNHFITLSSHFKQTTELHHSFPVQMQNENEDAYLLAFSEEKTILKKLNLPDSISGYYHQVMSQHFINELQNVVIDSTNINTPKGYHVIIANIAGKIKEKQVYYKIAFIESKDAIYQLVMWARDNNQEDIIKIIESFTEEKNV